MLAKQTTTGCLLLAGAICGGCSRPSGERLTLAGSTSVQPVVEKWAAAYERRQPQVSLVVQGGGSTAGVRAVLSGAAQVGLSSRALTSHEASMLRAVVVARDGIALVVHPTNPLRGLSLVQLQHVYAGNIRNWTALGGSNSSITVIAREEGSGTRAAFEGLVMRGKPIAGSTLVQDSTGAVRQMVASDVAAIGYISAGLVDKTVKMLSLGGVTANEATIATGSYPLVRPFLFLFPSVRSRKADDFVAWVTGPEGRAVARSEGLLPPDVEASHALR